MIARSLSLFTRKTFFNSRNLVLLGATLLLHLLALQSSGWQDWAAKPHPDNAKMHEKIIGVSMHALPAPARPAAVAPPENLKPRPGTEKKSVEKNTAVTTHAPAPQAEAPAGQADKMDALPAAGTANLPSAPLAQVTASAAAEVAEAAAAAPAAPEPPKYTFRAPESVEISMQLVRSKPDSNPSYGVGSIHWEMNDSKYAMRIEAGVDMLITSIHLYTLTSEGRFGGAGVQPYLSNESRLRRAPTATHFNYDDKTISFSASDKTIAMEEGAQDKASFLMQLTAMGYADEQQFFPGQEIRLQVAEEKDAAQFQFLVLNQEEITTKLGKMLAWHLVRPPRPGSYNSQLDIWLAPSFGWYPVQIRNTESNGTVTLQTATKIEQKTNLGN